MPVPKILILAVFGSNPALQKYQSTINYTHLLMSTEQQTIIEQVAKEVRKRLEGEGSGHDWWHIVRVWNMAKKIGREEGADMFIVELAALLHDIADWKFHDGDDTVGPRVAGEVLIEHKVEEGVIQQVQEIVSTISFKGAGVKSEMRTLEGKVVQDADRLDAIGAIGIARTFTYGGHVNRTMYNPEEKPVLHQTKEAYIKSSGPIINHFYEKLLLLKDRMNTQTAKNIAEERHKFMEEYLNRFFREWEGNA